MNEKNIQFFDKIRIVMVNTTDPGNIGASARAMKNMDLSNLYLVNPKNYPSATATARASNADDILEKSIVCKTFAESLQGTHFIIGTSVRKRNIKLEQLDVVKTCQKIREITAVNAQKVAVVFGTESSGLTNEELDLCNMIMTIPSSDNYSSLNLAAAVQIFAYQNYIYDKKFTFESNSKELANFDELENFYSHLYQALESINYFDNKRSKQILMRRLRNFFNKAKPEKDEVAILRGILKNITPFSK